MVEDNDIIDVEVLSETTAEVKKQSKPKKITSDHSRSIEFWGKLSRLFSRFGFSSAFVFGFGGLAFTILYSQSGFLVHLIFLCIAWSIAGLAIIAVILGMVFRRIMISLMKKDPNYEKYVS